MPMLYVICKTVGCGLDFATGLNIDKNSFATSKLVDNVHICPRRHANKYSKAEYHFKE